MLALAIHGRDMDGFAVPHVETVMPEVAPEDADVIPPDKDRWT